MRVGGFGGFAPVVGAQIYAWVSGGGNGGAQGISGALDPQWRNLPVPLSRSTYLVTEVSAGQLNE